LPYLLVHAANGEKLGTVHFATSCNEIAQKEFNRAVALLHSFQFRRAIDGFNVLLGEDATCGIAYWGIALSDWSNPFAPGAKDKSQLQGGRVNAQRGKTVGAKTERERAYIAAVGKLYDEFKSTPQQTRLIAYRDAMGEVAAKYPDDHEAQIFYALAVAASEDRADKTYAGRLKAGAILEELFQEEPTDPGLAHYIIHTYDVPALAERGLVAARRYSDIAPDAPHIACFQSWRSSAYRAGIAASAKYPTEGPPAPLITAFGSKRDAISGKEFTICPPLRPAPFAGRRKFRSRWRAALLRSVPRTAPPPPLLCCCRWILASNPCA